MTNLLVDSFATYGIGTGDIDDPSSVTEALLAGAYAAFQSPNGGIGISHLPWELSDQDFWLYGTRTSNGNSTWQIRRVLPSLTKPVIVSMYMAVDQLPEINQRVGPIQFLDNALGIVGTLYVNTTGTITFSYVSGSITTSGPVVVAHTAHHIEMKMNNLGSATGAFELWVDGTKVLDGTGLTFSNTNSCAQIGLCVCQLTTDGLTYISHLIVRDTNGSYNNDITGDRKVATLYVNADDVSNQGWTVRPLKRFGVGVLNLTASTAFVRLASTVNTDIGSSDFTIEGQFRFETLPTASNKAVLFGKWDETNNQRSYQLYKGGPDLEQGNTVFRMSTDGQSGTVVEIGKWDWEPVTGQYYHVALVRESNVVTLYVDGVQIGGTFADANTYYAGASQTALGAQTSGTAGVAGTYFDGWQDEFRLTIGTARYSANFTAPSAAFDRNGSDADWADVALLMSWDNSSIADDGPDGLSLVGMNSAAAITPDDGVSGYQVLDKSSPDDDTFIEAALIPATGTFTMSVLPSNTETVTVATKSGGGAAVYTFKTALASAYDVLIGADIGETADNLAAAINGGAGEGTLYGTGTVANADVTAEVNVSSQVVVTAITPGTAGNSLAKSETCANGAWDAGGSGSALSGGQDIPGYSQFSFERMPAGTTVVDSITLVTRQWKNDAGTVNVQESFVGGSGGVGSGTAHVVSTTPTTYFTTIEEDPDTSSGMTPTSILNGKVRINRTA